MIARKAFICAFCEGVYSDEPVSQCDCLGGLDKPLPHFIEGVITYPIPDTQVHGVSETPETDAAARRIDQSNFEDSWKDDFEPYAWVTSDFARDLERRLRDTEKLLAQYSAERDALVDCLAHLRSTDWFNETDDTGRTVVCGLDSVQVRKTLTNLTP